MTRRMFDGDWSRLRGAECVCPTCNRVFPSTSSFDGHLMPDRHKETYSGPWCKYDLSDQRFLSQEEAP